MIQNLSILPDMLHFLGYVETHKTQLTKANNWLSRKDLTALNLLMTEPRTDAKTTEDQKKYYRLHTCYVLAQAVGLVEMEPLKDTNILRMNADAVLFYRSLSASEQYFYLLESFWVHLIFGEDVDVLSNSRAGTLHLSIWLESCYSKLIEVKKGEARQRNWAYNLGFYAIILQDFGLVTTTIKVEYDYRYVESVEITNWGHQVLPILILARPIGEWNRANHYNEMAKRYDTQENFAAAMKDEITAIAEITQISREKLLAYTQVFRQTSDEFFNNIFYLEFPELIAAPFIIRPFIDNEDWFEDTQTIIFKVALMDDKKVYRNIAMSNEHTLDDLHDAIQDAFDFGNDHLYAFFLDKSRWSGRAFYHPETQDGYPSDAMQIGELALREKQTFEYLFDFGDNWRFAVTVMSIKEEPYENDPEIIESVGVSPEQYEDYEDDDEDEDEDDGDEEP
jgi:Plasmid pRiA4b ORF-3-like protein